MSAEPNLSGTTESEPVMARKLAANVWVDGVLHKTGTSPDKAVADQITNPAAWGESSTDDADAEDEKPKRTARKSTS